MAGRDKRTDRLEPPLSESVSGSDSLTPNCQNPAESREFLGQRLYMVGTSLQLETQWRWTESRANSSPGATPIEA